MRRTRFDDSPCPIARTADLVGDWWTPIVMREAFLGRRRFDELQQALSLSRSVLTQRLARLVHEGMLEKRLYQERPPRHEYVLTEKGRAFYPVLAAMWRWGSDWQWNEGAPPLELYDRETRRPVRPQLVDENTGLPIDVRRLRIARRRTRDCGDPTRLGVSPCDPRRSRRAPRARALSRSSRVTRRR